MQVQSKGVRRRVSGAGAGADMGSPHFRQPRTRIQAWWKNRKAGGRALRYMIFPLERLVILQVFSEYIEPHRSLRSPNPESIRPLRKDGRSQE